MKKLNFLFVIAAAICFMACGNKTNGTAGAQDSTGADAAEKTSKIEMPANPTGDIDNDAKAVADYMTQVMALVQDATQKLEAYNDKYKDSKEFQAALISGAGKAEDAGGNIDYESLKNIPSPTGDLNKDVAVAANVTSVMLSIGTNLETISEKYEKYYKGKGDEEYNKFEEALKNALPEDVVKQLEG